MTIRLSRKYGVNPSLTYCPKCGKEGDELLLLGDVGEYECRACGKHIIGPNKECPACGSWNISYIGKYEATTGKRLPGSICKECQTKQLECDAEVRKGGVYWRCVDCGSEGAIKADSNFAKQWREEYKTPAPEKIGVEFSKKFGCPVCGEKED